MLDFKDYLIMGLLVLAVVAIVCGLSFLIVCVSYWFIIPTVIFIILWPWFIWKIVEWWVWR
jgi:hypothetical protein